MLIVNDGRGTLERAGYTVTLKRAGARVRDARVENFRRARGAGNLVAEAFCALGWPEEAP